MDRACTTAPLKGLKDSRERAFFQWAEIWTVSLVFYSARREKSLRKDVHVLMGRGK